MIRINLLPGQKKKSNNSFIEKAQAYKNLFVPVVSVLIGVFVLIILLILVYPKWQKRSLGKWEQRWSKVTDDYEEAKKLKQEQKLIRERLTVTEDIVLTRLAWAPVFNAVSDALPSEIQFTEVKTRTERQPSGPDRKVLIILGLVPAYPGEKAIEEFVRNLKQNDLFDESFSQIMPPSSQTAEDENKTFTLKCYIADKFLLPQEQEEEEK